MQNINELLKSSELCAYALQNTAVPIGKIQDNIHVVAADNMKFAADIILDLIKYIESGKDINKQVTKEDLGWNPVSDDNLPDPGDDVLVTINLGDVNVVAVDSYSLIEYGGFEGYGKDVVAWMPMPAPYPKKIKIE